MRCTKISDFYPICVNITIIYIYIHIYMPNSLFFRGHVMNTVPAP